MPSLTIAAAVASAILLTALLARHGRALGFLDHPNHRSSHTQTTARGGGLAIVIGTVTGLASQILLNLHSPLPLSDTWAQQPSQIALLLSLPIALVGALDDWRGVPARWRFLTHLSAVLVLLLWLAPLPGFLLLPGFALPYPALWLGLLLFGVAWINFFNFMDGIDGLAASQGLFMLVAAASLSLMAGYGPTTATTLWLLMISAAASTAGFLMFNWSPARIFMGDVGSTWLGFILFATSIMSVAAGWMNFGSWLILAATFVVDASVTLLTRMISGARWFEAHRSHVYQRATQSLQARGQTRTAAHRRVCGAYLLTNCIWLLPLAWAAQTWPDYNLGLVLIAYAPLLALAVRMGAGRPAIPH